MKQTTTATHFLGNFSKQFIVFVIFFSIFIISGKYYVAEASEAISMDKKIEILSESINRLQQELEMLKQNQESKEPSTATTDKTSPGAIAGSAHSKFHFGGYGEMHANFNLDKNTDQFDFHRMVIYTGYDFSDWIRFNSELEIEHAFVSDSSGGELVFEQAYIDFRIGKKINIRAGRVLTPVGLVNRKHEPTAFNGVERPSFAKFIIPSTWSSDGIGIFGNLTHAISYEAYVAGGLDGSEFSATNGIRNGRIKERPGLHSPAVTGRIDLHPFSGELLESNQLLRVGFSGYFGGMNNGNKGNNPGIDGNIQVYAGDVEYSLIGVVDIRGEIAYEQIDNAAQLSMVTGESVAADIFGWYLEGAYHFWPDRFKSGRLSKSDAVVFLRYDDYDTQFNMPTGITGNPKGDRSEWTVGINFYPVPNLVAKVDYQIMEDDTGDNVNLLNLGLGWAF